jgi:hypothetical protein
VKRLKEEDGEVGEPETSASVYRAMKKKAAPKMADQMAEITNHLGKYLLNRTCWKTGMVEI